MGDDVTVHPKLECKSCGEELELTIMGARMGSRHWSEWACRKCGRRVEIPDNERSRIEIQPGDILPIRKW